MDKFDEDFNALLELWEEWTDSDEDINVESWLSEVLAIEAAIGTKISDITQNIDDYSEFLRKLDLDVDRGTQTIIFHLILSITAGGVFDKKIVLIDFIDKSLNKAPFVVDSQNNMPKNYFRPIAFALHYCELWIKEIVIGLMLKSVNIFCVISGLDAIADSRLKLFEPQCLSILNTIIDRGYKEEDNNLLSSLLNAIVATRATVCVPKLERLLIDKNLQDDLFPWQGVLFALVLMNSKLGWDTFIDECKTRGVTSENISLLGIYGEKKISTFIQGQLKSNNYTNWRYEYLFALGKLGDSASLKSIIDFIDNKEIDLIEVSLNAFKTITGTDDPNLDFDVYDCEKIECKKILLNWLNENKSLYDPDIRYFDGKPFSLQILINSLTDPNLGTRLSAIDQLSAYTNVSIPFNYQGFFSDMIKSKKEWQEWYDHNKAKFPDGYWYRDGKRLN